MSQPRPITRLELIARMGQEWRELRQRYPDKDSRGWRTLAVGIAIAALAEEEYRVDSWTELVRKKQKKTSK